MPEIKHRIKYTVASRDSFCLLKSYDFDEESKKLSDNGIEISLDVNSEPRTSLAETYNKTLDAEDAKEFDWIVFLHSDAAMDVGHFTNGLISSIGKYDIVGMAGAKRLNLKTSPLSWFTASRGNESGRVGMVMHMTPVGSRTPVIPSVFTPGELKDIKDDYVAAIDGVCIAVGRRAIENKDCRFDERFPFDFYDLDFSLTANKLGLSLGVVVENSFVHMSVGKGILKPEYNKIENIFREKWGITK